MPAASPLDSTLLAITRAARDPFYAAHGGATLAGVITHLLGDDPHAGAVADLHGDLRAARAHGLAEHFDYEHTVGWRLTDRGRGHVEEIAATLPEQEPRARRDLAGDIDFLAMIPDLRARAAFLAAQLADISAHGGPARVRCAIDDLLPELREVLHSIDASHAVYEAVNRPAAVLDIAEYRKARLTPEPATAGKPDTAQHHAQ